MLIGVPKEIKVHEYRVGMTPDSVNELTHNGHEVLIETGAGLGIGVTDNDYRAVGASIAANAGEVFEKADLIVKVKEPQPNECALLREGQILFTYLHLAPDPVQAELLEKSKCIAIAYETVTDDMNGLPLLAPMSEVAGRMSIQAGAHCLEKAQGGGGILLGGVPGVAPGRVVVLGGGVVGINAARMAMGLGAKVIIIDKSIRRLRELDANFGPKIKTILANMDSVAQYVSEADLVIGAVLVPGAMAPKIVDHNLLRKMRPGSAVVDVSIDQGGCFETSRPTTHTEPTYVVDEVIHYCVANMPGAVARTSAYALNNASLPFILALANKGYKKALNDDHHLMNGLNVFHGHITHPAVAKALHKPYVAPHTLLA